MRYVQVLIVLVAISFSADSFANDDFRDAIIQHDRFKSCFRTKMRTGYCSFDETRSGKIPSGTELIARAAEQLRFLNKSGTHTAAIVYFENQFRQLFAFLLDQDGLRGVGTSNVPVQSIVDGLRLTLQVHSRSTVRTPTNTEIPTATPPMPIEDVATHLFPGNISSAIESGSYDRIMILPWSGLSAIPFAALPLPGGKSVVDYSSLVILPDYEGLFLPLDEREMHLPRSDLRDVFTSNSSRAIAGFRLVVGNPTGDLVGAEFEAMKVADKLQASRLLTRNDATLDAVLRGIRQVKDRGGIVYLATHGISDDTNPMDRSFIALARGERLTGALIRDRRNDFDILHPLVIMSACQSGLGKIFGGGTFGISRAWYGAGAAQVIGSLWNVDDRGTQALMTQFTDYVVSQKSPEEALRIAMIDTRRSHPDPAIWASFVVFGLPNH